MDVLHEDDGSGVIITDGGFRLGSGVSWLDMLNDVSPPSLCDVSAPL